MVGSAALDHAADKDEITSATTAVAFRAGWLTGDDPNMRQEHSDLRRQRWHGGRRPAAGEVIDEIFGAGAQRLRPPVRWPTQVKPVE